MGREGFAQVPRPTADRTSDTVIETNMHITTPGRARGGFRHRILGAVALAAVLSLAGAARAQDTDDSAPPSAQGAISIPANITVYGIGDLGLRKPTAVVNGDIITGTDVDQRLALIVAANGGKIDPAEVDRLRLQVLRNLIDETLQIQAAKQQDLKVDLGEVDEQYERIAAGKFQQNPKALDAYLVQIGSSAGSLKRQILGELSWQAVLRRNVQPFVSVSETEVREVMNRMTAEKGSEEYRLGEIFLSATPESAGTVQQTAQQIVDQLKHGGSFVAYARQYSEASTAAVGGDLGWIQLAQLPVEVANVAKDLPAGQLAGPIPMRGGFDIIVMIDRRKVLTADPRDALLALKQISINLPAGTSEAVATQRATELAAAIHRDAKGCGTVDAVAAKIGAQVVANDQVSARNLPAALQDAMLKMSPGEITPPFGSVSEGVRVLMLCGRDDPPAANLPSFDDLMSRMQDDRVNKRAQLYLRDLRRDAIIEYN